MLDGAKIINYKLPKVWFKILELFVESFFAEFIYRDDDSDGMSLFV